MFEDLLKQPDLLAEVDADRPPVIHEADGFILAEHPAGQVPVDWLELSYPIDRAVENGLSVSPGASAAFVTTDGRTYPAVLVEVRGNSLHYEALVPFDEVGEIDGDLMPCDVVGQGEWPADTPLHSDVLENYVEANVDGARPVTSTSEVLRNQLRALDVYEEPVGPASVSAVIETVRRSLHPVVEANVSFFRESLHQNGDFTPITIDFGKRATVHIPPESQFAGIWYGEHRGQIVIHLEGLDWGTLPTLSFLLTYEPAEGVEPDELTAALKAAASLGRPRAIADWDGCWGPLGQLAETNPRVAEFLEETLNSWDSEPHSYQEPRPFSQALLAGRGGSQRFGVSFDNVMALGPVMAYRILRIAAEDELLRGHIWLGGDGEPITAAQKHGVRTRSRKPFRPHSSTDPEKGGWDEVSMGGWPPETTPTGGRTADDLEHVDDLAIWAYLTLFRGPWAFEVCGRQILEREAACAYLHAGWVGTTRGWGRSASSVAKGYWLFEDPVYREVLVTSLNVLCLGGEFARLIREGHGDRPVKTVRTVTDPRLLGGRHRALRPYEQSTVVQACCEIACVLGECPESALALAIARALAETIIATSCTSTSPEWPRWVAYAVGIPEDEDMGKLPPAGFNQLGTPEHAEWVHAGPDDLWTIWAGRAAYLLLAVDETLENRPELRLIPSEDHKRSIYAQNAQKIVDALRSANMRRLLDVQRLAELFRMTAAPRGVLPIPED